MLQVHQLSQARRNLKSSEPDFTQAAEIRARAAAAWKTSASLQSVEASKGVRNNRNRTHVIPQNPNWRFSTQSLQSESHALHIDGGTMSILGSSGYTFMLERAECKIC